MTQLPGHPVSFHRRSHRLRHDQPDSRPGYPVIALDPLRMHNDVGLHGSHPVLDRCAEFDRPPHPVLSREHVAVRAAVTQSATGGPCGADLTRLRGPRACASAAGTHELEPAGGCSAERCACPSPRQSPRPGTRGPTHVRLDAVTVGKLFVSLADRRVLRDISQFAAVSPTFGRLFEGTDPFSRGQTWPQAETDVHYRHNRHLPAEQVQQPVPNVAERLAHGAENC